MMDSIALTLQPHEFAIMDHDAFTPSARGIFIQPYYPIRRGGIACVCNPSRTDTARFGTLPRLTLYKRPAPIGFRIGLRVDISLPKLKFGNNFDELEQADFSYLCDRLVKQLERMGVKVRPETIKNAEVSSIHYSKNLPLTDYTSCSMVIREIAKGCVTRHLDSVKTDYRNDGSAIRFHASSHEVILYDKLKDLERGKISDKRAIEDNNAIQLSLLSTPLHKPLEVLRLEVRLGTRKKIKSLLVKLGRPCQLTFETLYSMTLAKEVLLHYWQLITPDMALLACSGFPSGELYNAIYREKPAAKPSQVLQLVGALAIIQKEGMDGLRTHLQGHTTSRTWYGLKKQLRGINLTSHMKYAPVRVAETHLHEFKPLRLALFQTGKQVVKQL